MHPRHAIKVLLVLSAALATGQQPSKQPAQQDSTPVLVIPDIGDGIMPIDGDWQFHLGDDPSWAQPSLDDSKWESIGVDRPWGAQSHPSYAGFAWYRRHIDISSATSGPRQYTVLFQAGDDAYEVYWNGKLLGHYGKLPPHAWWYYSQFTRTFPLEGSSTGVLAVRMWKAPLNAFSPAEVGGISYPPYVGDSDTVSLAASYTEWVIIQGDLFDYGLILLRAFIAFLCLVLWYRDRKEYLFIWVAIFTASPVVIDILNRLFRIPFPWNFARFFNQPIYVLYHVSLWFLLVSLLRLHENRTLVKWTEALSYASMAAGLADGILAIFWASATVWMQWADGLLGAFVILVEVFPFVIIFLGVRQKQDASRWAVALSALLLQMINTVADASALGQRFTHWTLFTKIIDTPLFNIQGVNFDTPKITSLVLFAAILFAVYRYALEQQARHSVMERELQSGREIQQVLVPTTLPALEGYAVTSAYQPAMEVGGDFFQIIPNDDGSAIVALGDVSGKGLKAGMNVSMIVGVLRAEAGNTNPAEMLASLNRCLVGRMAGGFATGMVFRVDQDGTVTFANAGHLPPYLNGKEYQLDASLPLGLIGYSDYAETILKLEPGDQLSVYTDGLLEATSPTGELFGFERMNALFANRPTAQEAMKAAIDFGQEDDITVLTITRLAAGVQSSTSLSAPVLAPEPAEA
ncbi:MAG: SpoIIE family protein phosphatase [Terracidiphilus sp.]